MYYIKPKFNSPENLIEMLEKFPRYVEQTKEYPSVFLLADYLGMSEVTFWRYRKDKGYEQYHDIIAQAMTKLGIKDMTSLHTTGSKASEISLKRIHKLTETQIIDQTVKGDAYNPFTIVVQPIKTTKEETDKTKLDI